MAEEITEEVIETPTEEVQEEPKEEVKEEPKAEIDTTTIEGKESFIKRMLNKVSSKSEPAPEVEEAKPDGDSFPAEFLSAARAAGMTDDEIQEYSIYSDDDLKELIPFLSKEEPQQEKPAPADEPTKAQEVPPILEKDEAWKLMKEEVTREISALKAQLKEVAAEKEASDQQKLIAQVTDAFDKASEKFEVFGKTEELPTFPAGPRKGELIPTSPAYKARAEVLSIANVLMAGGMQVKDAMSTAIDTYKGRSLEVDVKRKIVQDLKRNTKKLSAKRSGKETVKTFENEEDRRANVVIEAARKKGIELEG